MKKMRTVLAGSVLVLSLGMLTACGSNNATSDNRDNTDSYANRNDSDNLGDDLRDAGDDLMDGARDAGGAVIDGVEDVGDAAKDGLDELTEDRPTNDGVSDTTGRATNDNGAIGNGTNGNTGANGTTGTNGSTSTGTTGVNGGAGTTGSNTTSMSGSSTSATR